MMQGMLSMPSNFVTFSLAEQVETQKRQEEVVRGLKEELEKK